MTEVWTERAYHIERPMPEKREPAYEPLGPVEGMKWRSLIANGLCMGMNSPCVTDTCEVMCAYGRRYLKEKDQHAG